MGGVTYACRLGLDPRRCLRALSVGGVRLVFAVVVVSVCVGLLRRGDLRWAVRWYVSLASADEKTSNTMPMSSCSVVSTCV